MKFFGRPSLLFRTAGHLASYSLARSHPSFPLRARNLVLLPRGAPVAQACQTHCTGSAYFGVQYAIECWCSGTDSADYPYDAHGASTDCNEPCSGNAAETCGGDWAMNVYENV